jgi:hypothetical protein
VQAQPFNVAQCQSSNKVVDTAERVAIIAELNRAGPRFTPRKICYIRMQSKFTDNGQYSVLREVSAIETSEMTGQHIPPAMLLPVFKSNPK